MVHEAGRQVRARAGAAAVWEAMAVAGAWAWVCVGWAWVGVGWAWAWAAAARRQATGGAVACDLRVRLAGYLTWRKCPSGCWPRSVAAAAGRTRRRSRTPRADATARIAGGCAGKVTCLLLAGCAAAGDLFFPGPSCAQAGVGTNWLSDRQRLQDGRYVDWGGLVKEDGAAARWDGGNDAMGYTPAAEIF